MYAQVILSKAVGRIDQIFDYAIPSDLIDQIKIGTQVLIPFGRRKEIGYVVGRLEKSEVKGIKEIIALTSPQPLFTEKQVELAKWLADRYFSFFISALRLVMPPGLKQSEVRKRGL